MSIAAERSNVNQPPELGTVLARLREHFRSPDLRLAAPATALRGGFWAEMWTLTLAGHTDSTLPAKLVLRLAPDAAMSARETAIQASVAAQGYLTPRIHTASGSEEGMRAWSVMDFAAGHALLGGLNGVGALIALPRLATGLPDTLAAVAWQLHRLDSTPTEVALAAIGFQPDRIDGLLDHHRTRAIELDDARLGEVVERLRAGRPVEGRRVICHGDLHPFNVLNDNGSHVVLDWTAARIAEPAYDLAFTHLLIANPPLTAPRLLRPIINAAAGKIANRFIATYAKLSGSTVDRERFDWYRKLHATRILLDLTGWRADGTTGDHAGHPWFHMETAVQRIVRL